MATTAASASWGYRIGERRPAGQVNLCVGAGEARELAAIFRKYGVRAGFAALSNAPACTRRVVALTPVAVLDEVVVTPRAGDPYRISFVEVRVDSGETDLILITTRTVD